MNQDTKRMIDELIALLTKVRDSDDRDEMVESAYALGDEMLHWNEGDGSAEELLKAQITAYTQVLDGRRFLH